MSQITKRALEASLKHLLLSKPLDKITVTDICEDCGISRMTFYYHFRDIYDLVEWVCLEDARVALDGKKTYDTWEEGYLRIFDAVLENKPFILNVYRCADREQVENYLYRLTVRPEDKAFLANFYKYAFVGLMLDWIRQGMSEDPAKIVERVSLVMHENIPRALTRLAVK